MFTGIEYYGTVYGNRPYHRDIGETPEDMAKAVAYQEAKEKAAQTEYRSREIGEKPWEVPTRSQQQSNYDRTPSYQTSPSSGYEYRSRDIGERPEDVARAEARRPKTYDEMTEQERVLDMYA